MGGRQPRFHRQRHVTAHSCIFDTIHEKRIDVTMTLSVFCKKWRAILAALWSESMTTSSSSIDLSFLSDDVRNQLAHSRSILDQIQVLQSLLPKINDPEARKQVEESIKKLLNIANSVVINASTTSSNVANTIIISSTHK